MTSTAPLTETKTMSTTTNSPARVTIDRIEFVIVETHTAQDHVAAGRQNLASFMVADGFHDIVVRRPRGKVLTLARVWNNDPRTARIITTLGPA